MLEIQYTDDGVVKCIVCQTPVPSYVPEYCCDGRECGCYGQPIEPPLCSKECTDRLFSGEFLNKKEEPKAVKMWVRINTPRTPIICGSCSHRALFNPENNAIRSMDIPKEYTCPCCGAIGKTEIDY
jgi:hypothetical protein